MLFARLALPFSALILSVACSREPEWYPVPPQKATLSPDHVAPLGEFVEMNDPRAELYFVRDINKDLEGGSWRWTYVHPEFQFFLSHTEGLKFAMDFSVVETTFRQTGPVTLSVAVNGHALGTMPCPKPGDYRFEKPVPAAWLELDEPARVAVQADKLWTSPADGVRLGFTVARAGFVR